MSQKIVKRIKKSCKGDKKLWKRIKEYYGKMNVFEKTKFNNKLKEELK